MARQNSAYGLGGGGAGRRFDATRGGSPGRVVPQVYMEQTVLDAELAPSQVLNTSGAFSQQDQTRTGSLARTLQRLFVGVSIFGQIPGGQTVESLVKYFVQNTVLTPYIGSSPQEDYPLAAMVDTKFLDRCFEFPAIIDPGNFPALSFVWRSLQAQLPPADVGDAYTAALTIQAVFSEPLC